MKTILALYGRGNAGKTTVLLEVIERVRKIADKVISEEVYGEGPKSDRVVIFLINGVVVGIVTRGDREKELKENFDQFLKGKCEIVLCPTHSFGQTVEFVKTFEKKATELNWIEKTKSHNEDIHDQLNAIDVKIAFNKLIENVNQVK